MKKFTDFTNKWKSREQETSDAFRYLKRVSPAELEKRVDKNAWSSVRKLQGAAKQLVPALPVNPRTPYFPARPW